MNTKPIYVTGHKKPDTDAIVSAIAYSHYKNQLGFNTVPVRLGQLSTESEFLLEKFGVEEPKRMLSARCSLKEIDVDKPFLSKKDLSIKDALSEILENNIRTFYVVDDENKLEGVVTTSALTDIWRRDKEDLKEMMSSVTLDEFVKGLNAKVFNYVDNFKTNGSVNFYPTRIDDTCADSVVILNNDINQQKLAIINKCALLVICGEDTLDYSVLELAKLSNVAVIYTPYTPLETSQAVFESARVEFVMGKEPITFSENDSVEDATVQIAKSRFRSYPVIDSERHVVGSISRYHLFNYEKKKFILVDHNEPKQSVDDFEAGEIVEIVDHHKLGELETNSPIQMTFKAVGATATIVSEMFRNNNVPCDPKIQGILMGAIITDTMNLQSPTTTDVDREMIKYYEDILGINHDELAKELTDHGQSISDKKFINIVYDDNKDFRIENKKVSISQTICKSYEELDAIKESIQQYLNDLTQMNGYDLILVLFTNPLGSGSYILYAGNDSGLVRDAFGRDMDDKGFIKGLVSRKKQVLPKLIAAAKNA